MAPNVNQSELDTIVASNLDLVGDMGTSETIGKTCSARLDALVFLEHLEPTFGSVSLV